MKGYFASCIDGIWYVLDHEDRIVGNEMDDEWIIPELNALLARAEKAEGERDQALQALKPFVGCSVGVDAVCDGEGGDGKCAMPRESISAACQTYFRLKGGEPA